jgi:hypothetical protein
MLKGAIKELDVGTRNVGTGPLPRITNGKLNKREMRALYADAPERFEKLS